MKKLIFIILIILPFTTMGQVVCYESWKTFNENTGDTIDNIMVRKQKKTVYYDLNCRREDKNLSKRIKNDFIVVKKDSLVLINSSYLKRRLVNVSGGISFGNGYIPFYYSDKIIYIVYYQKYSDALMNGINMGYLFGGIIGGVIGGLAAKDDNADYPGMLYCVLDFRNHKAIKVNADELINLLAPYTEIRDAYLDTPGYKKQNVVNHYFREYIRALHSDSVYNFVPYAGLQKN